MAVFPSWICYLCSCEEHQYFTAFPQDFCVLRIVRSVALDLCWLPVFLTSSTLPPGVGAEGTRFSSELTNFPVLLL